MVELLSSHISMCLAFLRAITVCTKLARCVYEVIRTVNDQSHIKAIWQWVKTPYPR